MSDTRRTFLQLVLTGSFAVAARVAAELERWTSWSPFWLTECVDCKTLRSAIPAASTMP
jgi:hypothetical protein